MKQHLIAAAFLIAATGPAAAYTSYILPQDFSPDEEVTVHAAFASTFFTPAVGLPADIQLLFPDGAASTFDRVEVAGQQTVMNASLPRHGTYRITTGERLGEVTTLVAVDGGWRPMVAGETLPEGTQTTTLQTVTVADAYVSRGAPTRTVVDAPIGALALHPITHPNEVLVSQGMQIELLFNGAPFPNMPLVVYESGDADTDTQTYFVTDAAGRATVTFPQPGHYVIAARHRGAAPEGAPAQVRSYTTTLTLEVITAIPDYPPPPEQEEPRRRRRAIDQFRHR